MSLIARLFAQSESQPRGLAGFVYRGVKRRIR